MDRPPIIGLDLAKNVSQVHGVARGGPSSFAGRRRLCSSRAWNPVSSAWKPAPGRIIWARELTALGHEMRLIPPAYVRPYVKRGKTDAADAEAICGAVTRPTMRFVPIKSADRQAALLDHKARDFLVRQQTQKVNAIRAHLAEFGIVVAKGIHNVDRILEAAHDMPEAARPALDLLAGQLRDLRDQIDSVTDRIATAQAEDPLARRLTTVPGIGTLSSRALAATTPDASAFRTARHFGAWLGLTPRAHSSDGKERLGRISKAGNQYLRRLLYLGGHGPDSHSTPTRARR